MRKSALIGSIAATLLLGTAGAQAGPWEDGMVAYNRGDYRAGDPPVPPAGGSRAIRRRRIRSG